MRLLVMMLIAFAGTAACAEWRPDVTDGTLSLSVKGSPPYPNRLPPQNPVLVVECKSGRVKLHLDANTKLGGPGDELHEHRFSATYDEGKPEPLVGSIANANKGLFFPRAAAHVKRLLSARTLAVEVTPYQFSPAVSTFNVAGLDQHKELIDQHCRIK
jgi:hypothetical protein